MNQRNKKRPHVYVYIYTRIKRALRARKELRNHIMGLYYGIMLRNPMSGLYYGHVAELYHEMMLRNYITGI